jgi:asparagine synthase (glutamine-hydrolysing)
VCGIWFSAGYSLTDDHLRLIAHRGPDGAGWRAFASRMPVFMGHRRLAIIDTSEAAGQPMCYQNGRLWLVYNGEIYNYLELRSDLEALGHTFGTRSDSEVILAAYSEWGESCLDRFVGMFALVLYEPGAGRLFAARDRFGIKPLYYVNQRNGIAFASEIKQLIGLPGMTAAMNLPRVYDFLSAGMTDHTEETTFRNVKQLRPGYCVTIDLPRFEPGDPLPLRRWYCLPCPGTIAMSEDEAAGRFRELLAESVRLHLRSDVPVGSCLSGGLDSSSIVCLIDRLFREGGSSSRVNAVSACYEVPDVDERPFIEAVSAATKTEVDYVFPRAEDAVARAETITWHQDEPYGTTSIFAQWCVFDQARRRKIKVMLDGQGADEQLAGYHGGFGYYCASLLRRGRYGLLCRTLWERRQFHGASIGSQLSALARPFLRRRWMDVARRQQQRLADHDWLNSEAFATSCRTEDSFSAAIAREGFSAIRDIGELCVAMMQSTSLPMLLHYEDRNSMAHGVEARVPFLDHRLVEFSIGLGSAHKMHGGETKRVLRRAMTGILPEAVSQRRDKLGFATPEAVWFRGPLRSMIEAGVEDTLRRYPGLLNAGGTRRLVHDMLEGRRALDSRLWKIVNIGVWGRVFAVSL